MIISKFKLLFTKYDFSEEIIIIVETTTHKKTIIASSQLCIYQY